ncbi:MAG TPA: NADP oxidoreductase [Gammaproteobacteria bacterium]|nr:NADP oxidoreductase [Gammaproteobacteria bacterium]
MSTFRLDGKPIPFTKGQTIMEAALAASEYIPHLCHNPEFTPHGSCRVCVVQNNGRFISACTQQAQNDMDIDNSSTRVNDYRKSLLQMLFVEGNHVCPGCEKSGACQLQAVAYYVGMLSPRFTHFFPCREVDASHADVAIDFNRCILCELCVRASRDVDGKYVFTINGRGLDAHLAINSTSGKLGDSTLSVDDKAVQVCPVGAILLKNRAYDNPIGERLYDKKPVSIIGDVAANGNNKHD